VSTFLLELRTEEIPANALAPARQQLESLCASSLTEAGYEGFEVLSLSTIRRLVLLVRGLAQRQPDRSEELVGPPRQVAFAADGTPTKAAEGFARKAGVPVEGLELRQTDKGEYLAATVRHEGKPTVEILATMVPALVRGLRFPKMMRWGLGANLFVRPVHGVVALLDTEVVPFEVFGIASGRRTVGHRVHAPAPFDLEAADGYVEAMRERRVVVDPEERRTKLDETARALAAEVGAVVHRDDALMAEHVELVELPALVRGAIAERFLELPREVVITTLRHHQKCLVLEGSSGKLAPYFLAVIDRADDPEGLIGQGNEWVIGARLADAGFFFAEDRKRPLAELVPRLDRVEYHRQLGSLRAKALRVGALATELATALGEDADQARLAAAAELVKADLTTFMVGEFPELQGIMGGHYLRLEEADEELWTAARDHYQPQGFDGELPGSRLGRLIGVADRLETLGGLFAVGEIPSGSRDPFGLRRAAQGVVRIVAESGWDVNLEPLITSAVTRAASDAQVDAGSAAQALVSFMVDRVRRYLCDLIGVSGDTAEAVIAAGWQSLPAAVARARALEAVRASSAFRSLALAFKRVRNITEGQPDAAVDPSLFAQPEEGELHREALAFHDLLERVMAGRELDKAFAGMAPLAGVLDRFFVEVLVMTDDEQVRSNRIALLKALGRDFLTLADLSKLHVEGGEQ
jgi:glycyl-tRNA synthetase beta chain